MTTIALAEWRQAREAGVPAFAVGPVTAPAGLYLDRAEAEAAADEIDGRYIEWHGCTGHQVLTAAAAACAGAYPATPEPETELEALI